MGQTKPEKTSVFWSFLLERTILGHAVDAILDVAQVAAIKGYTRISVPYQRTDMARNRIVQSFLELAKHPDDTIVMLDGDHMHPSDILARLTCYPHEVGVIGALYFRRGVPYDPLFFVRSGGKLRNMAEWQEGMVYQGQAVATGAIAIKRWVFDELTEAGTGYPFFQYKYPEGSNWSMTEDMFFAEICEDAGIDHYCDTGVITPHLSIHAVTKSDWDAYVKENPLEIIDRGPQEDLQIDSKGD